MKFTYKRLLILFSIALNIGFIFMAATLVFQDRWPSHERLQQQLIAMVERLDLPDTDEMAAIENLGAFKIKIHELDGDLKQAHIDLLRMLSQNKPLDQSELNRMFQQIGNRAEIKNIAFQAHVTELRNQLGDEKGAQFFSYLLDHMEKGDAPPPR